jgi:hypothetical protein
MSSEFDPLWFFRFPLSDAVNQRITAPWFSPNITVKYAGDPVIEDRVVTEVASYGKQLGWLTDVVLAMAKDKQIPVEDLDKLEKAAAAIAAIKRDVNRSSLELANAALDKLKHDDPHGYRRLIGDRSNRAK